MPGKGEISLEQLYKMLHVSKRKAAWMLNNGIIPCRIRPTKTHRYIVPKSALVEFLVDDFAFEIVHKSTWHMNTILLFVEKE